MAHLRRTAIPNAWDDEDDWGVPAATTSAPSAPIILASSRTSAPAPSFPAIDTPVIITSSQQPKTFYKPEITLLKRASPSATLEPKPSSSSSASSRSEEKERKERERKEKERRYQEAKDRIFAASSSSGTSTPEKGKGKRSSGKNTPKKASPPPPPPPIEKAARPLPNPKPTPPQPQSTGAITGFSLNAGSFSAAPVKTRERDAWQLRQVALDGKMLESQAQQYGFGRDEELLGDKERGLDWDEFRRDRWEGGAEDEVTGRLGRLELVEVGESADEPASRTPRRINPVSEAPGVVTPVREPRGPEGSGKGFSGRGRGSGRRGGAA
jgi:hypothetical protein